MPSLRTRTALWALLGTAALMATPAGAEDPAPPPPNIRPTDPPPDVPRPPSAPSPSPARDQRVSVSCEPSAEAFAALTRTVTVFPGSVDDRGARPVAVMLYVSAGHDVPK